MRNVLSRILKTFGVADPKLEVWRPDRFLIADASDEIVFEGPVIIEYQPGQTTYEGGHGSILDPETGATRFVFTLLWVKHEDDHDLNVLSRAPYIGSAAANCDGLTIGAQCEPFGQVRLFLDNHAASFFTELRQRRASAATRANEESGTVD